MVQSMNTYHMLHRHTHEHHNHAIGWSIAFLAQMYAQTRCRCVISYRVLLPFRYIQYQHVHRYLLHCLRSSISRTRKSPETDKVLVMNANSRDMCLIYQQDDILNKRVSSSIYVNEDMKHVILWIFEQKQTTSTCLIYQYTEKPMFISICSRFCFDFVVIDFGYSKHCWCPAQICCSLWNLNILV